MSQCEALGLAIGASGAQNSEAMSGCKLGAMKKRVNCLLTFWEEHKGKMSTHDGSGPRPKRRKTMDDFEKLLEWLKNKEQILSDKSRWAELDMEELEAFGGLRQRFVHAFEAQKQRASQAIERSDGQAADRQDRTDSSGSGQSQRYTESSTASGVTTSHNGLWSRFTTFLSRGLSSATLYNPFCPKDDSKWQKLVGPTGAIHRIPQPAVREFGMQKGCKVQTYDSGTLGPGECLLDQLRSGAGYVIKDRMTPEEISAGKDLSQSRAVDLCASITAGFERYNSLFPSNDIFQADKPEVFPFPDDRHQDSVQHRGSTQVNPESVSSGVRRAKRTNASNASSSAEEDAGGKDSSAYVAYQLRAVFHPLVLT
jgi:hypothetical protein